MKKKKGNVSSPVSIGKAHIELISNTQAYIDGCCGVIEYSEDKIRLDIGEKTVCFKGDNLSLGAFFLSETSINGNIISIEFCD